MFGSTYSRTVPVPEKEHVMIPYGTCRSLGIGRQRPPTGVTARSCAWSPHAHSRDAARTLEGTLFTYLLCSRIPPGSCSAQTEAVSLGTLPSTWAGSASSSGLRVAGGGRGGEEGGGGHRCRALHHRHLFPTMFDEGLAGLHLGFQGSEWSTRPSKSCLRSAGGKPNHRQ